MKKGIEKSSEGVKNNFLLLVVGVVFVFCFIEGILAAPPQFTGYSGALTDGSNLTIDGIDFGAVIEPEQGELFDDYSADYSCNTIGCIEPTAGSMWSWDGSGNWDDMVFSGEPGAFIFGEDYWQMRNAHAMYSTGRGMAQFVEYYEDSGTGAHPNSAFAFNNLGSNVDEIYLVYYSRYAGDWIDPWNSIGSYKKMLFYQTSGSKWHLILDNAAYQAEYICGVPSSWSDSRFFPIVGETNGDTCSFDVPTADAEWPEPGKWHEYKMHIKYNTGSNEDGVFEFWMDGSKVIDDNTCLYRTDGSTLASIYLNGNIQSPGIHEFLNPGANTEWPIDTDDVFLWRNDQAQFDNKFPMVATVYLSNQAIWNGGPNDMLNGDSNFVRQIVGGVTNADLGFKSWSDAQFMFEVVQGTLDFGSPVYLYVTNWDGETNVNGFLLATGPDTTSPIRSGGSPSGTLPSGTTQDTIALNVTDASGVSGCRYSTTAGTAYASMTNTLANSGGDTYSATVSGLTDGGSYNYYVRCIDTLGNANTNDFTISFSVASASACGGADSSPVDGVVSISELLNYISAWKFGSVTISDLLTGIGEWKNGC